MQKVATDAKLDFEEHFLAWPPNRTQPITLEDLESDNATLIEYLVKHQNETQNALLFQSAYLPVPIPPLFFLVALFMAVVKLSFCGLVFPTYVC